MYEASALNMYFSEYLVEAGMFDFGSTYKDFYFDPEKPESGKTEVAISMEMMEDAGSQEIRLYFFYNYESMKPSRTICMPPRADDNECAFTELTYETNEAVWWDFTADAENFASVQTALEQNTFSFDTLVENGIEAYAVAKMNVQTGAGDAYEYRTNSTGEFATQEDAATLFNEVYATAKDFLIKEKLDFDTAKQMDFAQEMMEFGNAKVKELTGQ